MPRPLLPVVGADSNGSWGTKNNALWTDAHTSLDRLDAVVVVADLFTSNTAAQNTAALVAAEARLPVSGGGIQCPGGTFDYNGFLATKDNVLLQGIGRNATTLRLLGAGVGLGNSTPATLRSRCGARDLTINGQSATTGARMVELNNCSKWRFRDVYLNATTTPGVTGVKFIGGTVGGISRSTYFNEFHGVDIVSDVACYQMGDWCNRNRFFGGVLEGAGHAVLAQPTNNEVTDTCLFVGVSIQTSGAVGVQLGGGGGLGGDVSYFDFLHCMSEPETPTQTFVVSQGIQNTVMGGTWSRTTFTAAPSTGTTIYVPANGLFRVAHEHATAPKRTVELLAANAGITLADDVKVNWFRRTTGIMSTDADSLEIKGGLTSGYGSGSEFRTAGSAIYAWGSASNSFYLDSKGSGEIQLNTQNGATGGTRIEAAAGKVGFYGTIPVVRPAANPDTTGATLAALETEVNELKAILRTLGLLTP